MEKQWTTLQTQGKEITLIGTAHVSKVSAQQVKEALEEIQPDSICVELDEDRYQSLMHPGQWEQTDIVQVIKQKKTGFLLANIILSSYQKKIAKKMDISAGAEMMQGIQSAKELNAELVLADRRIQTTFSRIWRKHSFWQKCKLLTSIVFSLFDDEDITEADLEQLKQSDMLESALKEVGDSFPVVADVLIHERDQYLATKIAQAKGPKVVAVLGAAHVPGVSALIESGKLADLNELDSLPPKSIWGKVIGWGIPIAIVALVCATFLNSHSAGWEQIQSWILWNGTLSAIGTLLAGGHPLSILTAFVAAPITSLNPLLAAGWFAGLVEASVRKPKVKDFENLTEDFNSVKGMWKNRVTRILLVVILANVFSSLGTFIGGTDIIKTFLETVF